MNLQTMTIIFVIIFLPIILISTYYIQREVDTINMQASYDTKLIGATTDAVSAFEINTSNEDLSAVSDSLRSIIEASNNVFTTTLASNMGLSGASKSRILPYIPAIVYVLYDGYYIYSPTKQAKVVTDPDGVYVKVGDSGVSGSNGSYTYNYVEVEAWKNDVANKDKPDHRESKDEYGQILYYDKDETNFLGDRIKCTTNPATEDAYQTTSYILKSFSPYSMQYQNGNKNFTINYTLDNFITVYGSITESGKETYYSKSGYLIDCNDITSITVDRHGDREFYGATSSRFLNNSFCKKYSQNEIEALVNDNNIIISITFSDGTEIKSDEPCAISENYKGEKISDNKSAIEYYLDSYIFTKWVEENLGDITSEDILVGSTLDIQNQFSIKQNGNKIKENSLFWEYNEKDIFKGDYDNESAFYEHKTKVIKNSIQYNLNLSMALYNKGQGDKFYQMPILSEPEWDKLLSNVSVLAFMQGLPCGLKTYNNYAIVTSSNNELMANVEDIYYVPIKKDGTGNVLTSDVSEKLTSDEIKNSTLPTAHLLSCDQLIKNDMSNNDIEYFQAFPSREVKHDKVWDSNKRKYVYDHVCNTCYYCIVNKNNDKNQYELYKKEPTNSEIANKDCYKLFRKAELIAIGKIRNNTYKSSDVVNCQGIRTDNFPTNKKLSDFNSTFDLDEAKKCYEIDITIKGAQDASDTHYGTDWIYLGSEKKSYNCNLDTCQTIVFDNSSNWTGGFSTEKSDLNKLKVVSITYKYK